MHGHHLTKIILVILLGLVIAAAVYNYTKKPQVGAPPAVSDDLI